MCDRCLTLVLQVFYRCFTGVLQGCVTGVLLVFYRYVTGVIHVFYRCFTGVYVATALYVSKLWRRRRGDGRTSGEYIAYKG